MITAHSEYGKLQRLLIKRAHDAFRSPDLLDQQWSELNYQSRPEFDLAMTEYASFEAILKAHEIELEYFDSDDSVTIDSMYCRDATIVTDHGIILCHMGKEQRKPEPAACASKYQQLGLSILGEITAPGKVEGGDVAWLDEKTLAIAHGYRTNDEGYIQMQALLAPFGINLIQVDLPHYKGPSDVFHLMSIFSPVDKDKAVVYSSLMPVRFRDLLLDRGFQLIEVPDEEFESMGCNVLALSPSKCLMVEGNPITKQRLIHAHCDVIEYVGQEISVKGGGGPTCLTRPISRMI